MNNKPGISASVSLSPVEDTGLTQRDISGLVATDYTTAGTGTASNEAEAIEVTVPDGATVTTVYLHWARRVKNPSNAPDSQILVNGSVVEGNIIGGPIQTSDGLNAPTTYLADISDAGLVSSGTSIFSVEDDAGGAMGASVIVFYDEETGPAHLQMYDGADWLWADDVNEALRTAEPVTFNVPAADQPRNARLTLFVGDVAPETSRPNALEITIGEETILLGPEDRPFTGADGAKWDNFTYDLTVPAGVTDVTVEPISPSDRPNSGSLAWSMAGLSVQPADGDEGCTPGYWRQSQHFDSWPAGRDPGDPMTDAFVIPDDLELARPEHNTDPASLSFLQGLELRGGSVNALIRHAIAALLNAENSEVSYDLTSTQIIDMFNSAVESGEYESAKDHLEEFNEQTCPLN